MSTPVIRSGDAFVLTYQFSCGGKCLGGLMSVHLIALLKHGFVLVKTQLLLGFYVIIK